MAKPVIFHIDVNSAFLSWEAHHRLHDLGETLDIRTIPATSEATRKPVTVLFWQNPPWRSNVVSLPGNPL